jgi:N-methylhydantoinase A
MSISVAIDVGGTFTDLISLDSKGQIDEAKTPTTPADPSQGIFDVLAKAEIDYKAISYFVHGSTVGTNLLIERRGPNIGLIATRGFRDILRIQRVVRPRSFDLHWVKPRHLVERDLSLEVNERIGAHGEVVQPLNEDDVRIAIEHFRKAGITAIAISYMFSFLNASHEIRTRELIHSLYPEAYVSISSDVYPQWREYERTSTTVIDVYLKPRIDDYLTSLESGLQKRGNPNLLIMRSNGGVMTTSSAREQPVTMIQSGPAGGVIASLHIGRLLAIDPLMTADIGGTSFDTSLIEDGQPSTTSTTELEFGMPISTPMLDIRSVGAGGGSLAWIDSAGIMKVGPESAGAIPGPACYGRGGTIATSTDANIVLGRLDPDFQLGGDVQLDPHAARNAVQQLGAELGLGIEQTAVGILEIMNNNMAETMRLLTIDRGLDPREFSLVAFGGAGPLHGAYLAEALGMNQVVIPPSPGAFSALGALMADTRFDYVKTRISYSQHLDFDTINTDFAELEKRASIDFAREGFAEPPKLLRSIDFRYSGQNWELEVAVPNGTITSAVIDDARRRYDTEHNRQFGWSFEDSLCELVNFRVVAVATKADLQLPKIQTGPLPDPIKSMNVHFDESGDPLKTAFYQRSLLTADNKVTGPAIFIEEDATTLVPPGWTARIEAHGSILLQSTS